MGDTGDLRVCVVIAAYNEAGMVGRVVAGAKQYLEDVLVVDDGSTDTTADEAKKAGADLLRHESNRGKGHAIRSGIDRVLSRDFTHVLLMDADMQP